MVIIGAGPIGMACGIAAQKAGLSYAIIEKGCLVNSIYHYPVNMTFFSTSERLEIGGVPFISHGDKPTRREALDYYRRVAAVWKLRLRLYERVEEIRPAGRNAPITIKTDKSVYQTLHLILATGFYDLPNWLNVPGEKLSKVRHYFDEAHPYAFQKVAVVGAANSAVDVALETYRKGAEVTMVIREASIQPGVKYWVRPDIENRIKEGSIRAYFNSEITDIREREIDLATPEGPLTLPNDFVLAMTGYQPDFTLFRMAGIHIAEDEQMRPNYDPITHQTNQPGIYLAGVACGGLETNKWFIENSRGHADQIVEHILAGGNVLAPSH